MNKSKLYLTMLKKTENLPAKPPSGQHTNKPVAPPSSPSVNPPVAKTEGSKPKTPHDIALEERNRVLEEGHKEHSKTNPGVPLTGKSLELLHHKAWKAFDDKFKELTGTHTAPTIPTDYGYMGKSESKVHVKEFIVPISKGGMLRWHADCLKTDDSSKSNIVKNRTPDTEYTREASSGLNGMCVGCLGELGNDPNNVPVHSEDLSTEKSEIALNVSEDKKKYIIPLKHHYEHLLNCNKLLKNEQATKEAKMCAVYLKILGFDKIPNEIVNSKISVDLNKTEHPLDKEAKKLVKNLSLNIGANTPMPDTIENSSMLKDENNKDRNKLLSQAKKLHADGLKGWGKESIITDREKATQASELYKKAGYNYLSDHINKVLSDKSVKDLTMKKNENCGTEKPVFEPLMKIRGMISKLNKCGDITVVKKSELAKAGGNYANLNRGGNPGTRNAYDLTHLLPPEYQKTHKMTASYSDPKHINAEVTFVRPKDQSNKFSYPTTETAYGITSHGGSLTHYDGTGANSKYNVNGEALPHHAMKAFQKFLS